MHVSPRNTLAVATGVKTRRLPRRSARLRQSRRNAGRSIFEFQSQLINLQDRMLLGDFQRMVLSGKSPQPHKIVEKLSRLASGYCEDLVEKGIGAERLTYLLIAASLVTDPTTFIAQFWSTNRAQLPRARHMHAVLKKYLSLLSETQIQINQVDFAFELSANQGHHQSGFPAIRDQERPTPTSWVSRGRIIRSGHSL